MNNVPLYELAHARTGDKGSRANISLIAYRPQDYQLLVDQVTEERVAAHFAHRKPTRVQRSPRRRSISTFRNREF